MWVPSHIGIHGNEKADQAAKSAAGGGSQFDHETYTYDCKAKLRADIHDLWEVYWHKTLETKGKWLGNLIECIPNRPWFEKFSFRSRKFYSTINRLRLGHFRLKTHLYRINLANRIYSATEIGRASCRERV